MLNRDLRTLAFALDFSDLILRSVQVDRIAGNDYEFLCAIPFVDQRRLGVNRDFALAGTDDQDELLLVGLAFDRDLRGI